MVSFDIALIMCRVALVLYNVLQILQSAGGFAVGYASDRARDKFLG